MIYEIKHNDKVYEIDDLISIGEQPEEIRELITSNTTDGMCELEHNAIVVFKTGRIIINGK